MVLDLIMFIKFLLKIKFNSDMKKDTIVAILRFVAQIIAAAIGAFTGTSI